MKKILLLGFIVVLTSRLEAQDLISGGSNSWIFHTPDDGRTTLYIAPKNGSSNWDFSKQTQFLSNGDIITTGRINLPRITGLSSGNLVINAYDGGGGNGHGIEFYAVQNGFNFKTFAGSWDSRFFIADNGEIGVGTIAPESKLHVDGDITFKRGSQIKISSFSGGGTPSQTHTIIKNGWRHNQDYTSIHAAGITGNTESSIVIKGDGNVGIGTTNPTQKLQVAGTVYSTEVKVELAAGQGPDYVFEPDYELMTLQETKEYIAKNKHLPEIPSAKEMEANGVELGDMNMKLLKKIEELTLYQIQLMEEMEAMKKELQAVMGF